MVLMFLGCSCECLRVDVVAVVEVGVRVEVPKHHNGSVVRVEEDVEETVVEVVKKVVASLSRWSTGLEGVVGSITFADGLHRPCAVVVVVVASKLLWSLRS